MFGFNFGGNTMEIQLGPIKATPEQAKLLACLLISYGFSFYYWQRLLKLNYPRVKQFYLGAVGLLFLWIIFPWDCLVNILLPPMVVWWVAREHRSHPWMPVVVMVGCMLHLAGCHIWQTFLAPLDLNNYRVDMTTPLMIMTIKLTSFAFDMADGYRAARRRSSRSSSQDRLGIAKPSDRDPSAEELAKRMQVLRRYPSLLEFFGYALCFPGILTGPVVSFVDYRAFIDGSYFAGVDLGRPEAVAGRKRRAFRQFVISLAFLGLYVSLRDLVTVKLLLEPPNWERPLWYRLAYLHFAHLISRSKYYFAWLISEGSYIIIGLGFRRSPTTGKPLWDRRVNCNARKIELGSDFRRIVAEWNVATNQWLYDYVYKRIGDYYYPGRRPGFRANLATNVISAFWHGFHPGYYFMFISIALYTQVCRLIYNTFTWPWGAESKRYLLYLPNFIIINYITAPFVLLTWSEAVRFCRAWHWWGHILLIVLWISLKALHPLLHSEKKRK